MAEPLHITPFPPDLRYDGRALAAPQDCAFVRLFMIAFLLLSPGAVLLSQPDKPVALDPRKSLTQYTFDTWETGKTPLEGGIRSILQTKDGYLWVGTQEGLYRFDGDDFAVFNSRNRPEMKSSSVFAPGEDREGVLWIATRDGLLQYKENAFQRYTAKDGLNSNSLLSLCVDEKGDLWVGSSGGGLTRLSGGVFAPYTDKGELRFGTIWSILNAKDSSLWIGTASAGVFRIKNGKETNYTVKNGLLSNVIRSICEGRDGCIWIGTQSGVNRFKGGRMTSLTTRDGLSNEVVMQLFEDSQGSLWIGTGGGGINRYALGRMTVFTSKDRLTNDNVLAFVEDREGSLWVGTGDGLNRFKDEAFTSYTSQEGLSNDVVWCVYEDSKGVLWLGTNGGLNRVKGGNVISYTTRQGLSNNTVSSVCEDSRGTLWIGTYGGGLCQMNDGRITRSQMDIPPSAFILAIYEDHRRSLWIGTNDGLFAHSGGHLRRYATQDGLAGNFIRFIYEERSGEFWIGTNEGLTLFSANRFTKYTTRNGLTSNSLMCMYEDRDHVKWFGTDGGGLIRLKEDVFTAFTTRDGLPGEIVYEILEDDLGYLWMGGDRGVCRVNENELNDYVDGKIGLVSFVMFGKNDGMRARECNGGSQPAGWKSKDGRLWFSTVKGVAVINPRNLKTNTVPPSVVLQYFSADNKAIPFSRDCYLAAGTNRIEFRYAGLSFVSPGDVTFRYMLEEYDKNWVNAGTARSVTYTNIPPGHYTFRVIAANEDGTWNTIGASFSFHLRSHFYQTKTFFALVGVTIVVLAIGAYSLRTRRLVRRTHELESVVARRTEEIVRQKDALENVNRELSTLLSQLEEKSKQLEVARVRAEEANQAKSAFLANVSHELRTPLNSVIGFTNIMLKNKGKNLLTHDLTYLERILENGKHLLELIEDVLDLSRIEAGHMGIRRSMVLLQVLIQETVAQLEGKLIGREIEVTAEVPNPTLPIETDPGRLKQILINLVGNAIKFTDQGFIKVRVAVEPDTRRPVRIDVVDTGIGIPVDQQHVIFEPFTQGDERKTRKYGGTGLGLAISRTLCELLGYSLEVKSEAEVGSTFSILLDPNAWRYVYADQEILQKDQTPMSDHDDIHRESRSVEQETKEKILVGLRPFSHGEWAHMNINRIALFGRNLLESTSPRHYDRFRAALTEYLEKIQPSIMRIAQQFQIIHFDPTVVQALKFHADEFAKIVEALSLNPRLSEDNSHRFEVEIPKHVDQLLHAFRVMREQIHREFQCRPNEVLQRLLKDKSALDASLKLVFPRSLSTKNPAVVTAENDFVRIVRLLMETPLTAVVPGSPRELSFLVRTAGDRWALEMRDKSAYLEPDNWAGVFALPTSSEKAAGLAQIPVILAKYEGDICIKESLREGGTTILLRLKLIG